MTLIDLRASALNVTGYPGNAHTITLAWPAGTLDGTTWAATVGGEPVDSVTVDGDDLVVELTIPETVGGYELLLIQTDVDAVKAAGRVRSTETPTTDTDSTNLTVTLSTAEGSVTVVGTGPAGPGGAGGVTDGDKGDVVVSGSGTVWSLEDGVVTPAKLSFDPATQSELDGEATTRANADTALDGRLDTVEATLPTKADLVAGVVPDGQLPAGLTRDAELVAYVDSAIDALLDGAPGALDTLNELAAAIGDDASFAATVTTALAGKQAAAAELTVLSGLSSTALGRTLLTIASEAAARTAIGLGNVDNTADLAKPISTATQTALDAKAPLASPALTGTPTAPTQTAGNDSTRIATTAFVKGAVDSATSALATVATTGDYGDLANTPTLGTAAAADTGDFATAAQGALADTALQDAADVVGEFTGTPDGTKYLRDDGTLATPAGGGGGVSDHGDLTGLADDDHTLYALADGSRGAFATTVQGGKADTALQPAAIGATVQAYDADLSAIAGLDSATAGALATDGAGWVRKTYAQLKTALGLVKADVGLGNVDNTADTAKPVSTATQTALNLKADLASPALTGNPTAPTQTAGNNTTRLATTAFVAAAALQVINAQTGTTYTLVLADAGKLIECTNSSPITLTVPPNSSVAFPIGARIDIAQGGAGALTIAQGSGVTIKKPASLSLVLQEQESMVTLVKTATNTWRIAGDLTSV